MTIKKIHPEEAEANQFARELLMPENMVRKYFRMSDNRQHPEPVQEFAKRFAVPVEQAAIRLKELGIID